MKVQQTQNLRLQNQTQIKRNETIDKSNVSFKGGMDTFGQFLRFLDTNQAWGANFVDFAFMVTPRTTVDFTRGPDAGFETMRREASGTVNHSLVGAYGLGAAYLLSQGLNKDFKVKAHKLFANDESIDAFGHIWHKHFHAAGGDKEKALKSFLTEIVEGLEGKKGDWNKLTFRDEKTKQAVIDILEEGILNKGPKKGSNIIETWKNNKAFNKLRAEKMNYIHSLIREELGTEQSYKFVYKDANGVTAQAESSLKEMLNTVHRLSKTFLHNNVEKAFESAKGIDDNLFLKGLKKLNTKTSIIGLGIAALIGCNIQPVNMYLTRKKTGKSDFVGGGEPDHSAGFKALKVLAAGLFGAMVLKTINAKNLQDFGKKIQFKGFTPTIDQFKAVYGMTIMSRFIVARNKNELREATTKDTLGFLNWMLLGSFVQKMVASGFEKYAKLEKGTLLQGGNEKKSWFGKTIKSSLITRDEVLVNALKDAGISTVKGGKALSYKEMINAARMGAETSPILKTALKKISYLHISQLTGFAYMGVILGMGIPKLNIAITKAVEKKQKATQQARVYNKTNIAFLSNTNQNQKSFVQFNGTK